MSFSGSAGFGGDLRLKHVPAQRPHKAKSIRVPGGRVILTRDKGQAKLLSNQVFASNLRLIHRAPAPPGHPPEDGVILDVRDTGSGLVTNAGVNLMSNDFGWTTATLKAMNSHALGTGATAATSSDVWLQTFASNTNFAGTTNGYMTGTQAVIANSTSTPWSPVYQTSATFTCNGGAGIAITEWVLTMGTFVNVTHAANSVGVPPVMTLTDTTNSPFTAAMVQATIQTGTATPLNTPGTTPMMQIASQTATVVTGLAGSWATGTKTWLGINNQAVAAPSGTPTYVVFPTAWDHKVFGTVTINNGDTLQTIYQLSINSGG